MRDKIVGALHLVMTPAPIQAIRIGKCALKFAEARAARGPHDLS